MTNITLKTNFIDNIKNIITKAQSNAVRSINTERVIMYWNIGKAIQEEEQEGKDRADYGSFLIKNLAKELRPEYGTSFSASQLHRCRKFYNEFPKVATLQPQLSWSHYKLLIPIDNITKREFYEIETAKNNWSIRQLERQINSQLYERLLLSSDKDRVLAVAKGEEKDIKPTDVIKDPMYLEFLGLKPQAEYYEKDLENAIITQLQNFILELGNGFTFVARQKRIHLDGDDFFVDLVFYNRLLKCFVILELKTHKLSHEDLGQLQLYVNYYDRVEKLEDENPTIGILLCTDKNDAVVKFSLPEDNKTILASKYELVLPSEDLLIEEVKKEIEEFEGRDNE
jgi:predicted nuclease of restriction endonuclease-like (RecB) superfamily